MKFELENICPIFKYKCISCSTTPLTPACVIDKARNVSHLLCVFPINRKNEFLLLDKMY